MGNGGNFDVPQEVMAVLPQDPYEQLEIARRITAMAVVESLSKLESENGKLRTKLAEKDYAISELQDRVSDAEGSLQETESRLSAALDDHSKVTNEKNLLVNTVKKLNRDVAKLETFKRTLMQSLQDDGDEHKPAAGGGDGHGHASSFASIIGASNAAAAAEAKKVSKDSWRSSSRASVAESDEAAESGSTRSHESNDVKHVEVDNRPMSKPHQQPNRAAVPAPASQSPPQQQQQHQAPAPVESSQWQSSARSPERAPAPERAPPVETKLTMPLSLPSSRSTTAPNSPPNANSQRTPRVDGKEFFRQARNRLSYEQFSSFLANIKELNAHRQSREETLRKADKTFGPENKDLYIAFDGLLSRHLAT